MSLKISKPPFYHREYEHDIRPKSVRPNRKSYLERITVASMPFLSLYKPAEKVISLAMGSARVVAQGSEFKNQAGKGISYEVCKSFLKTTTAVSSLALTIAGASSFGMAITTAQDLLSNCEKLYVIYNQQGLSWDTSLAIGRILNNGLYLGLVLCGSFKFMAISFTAQVLTNLCQSLSEFKEGNYIEAFSHFSMSVVRGSQFYSELQAQKAISTVPKEKIEKELEITEKSVAERDSRFKKEIVQGRKKWDPALELLEKQHQKQLYQIHGTFSENFHYSKDSSGNLKAVWLCEDKNWNFAVRSASYNSQSKIWTPPKDQSIDLLSHFSFGDQLRNFNQGKVFIKIKMDSLKNLSALCVLPGKRVDQWNVQGTLQAIAFDAKEKSWFSSELVSISSFSDRPKSVLADLGVDQYGNITTIWHDAGNRTLVSMHYKKEEKSWSSALEVDSKVFIDELHLIPVPSKGMVAIWKGAQAIEPTKKFFQYPRSVIRASGYNPTENIWACPLNLLDMDSLRLREIENFLFHVDSQGNIVVAWEEAPDDRILEFYDIIQYAKQYPDQFDDWFVDDDAYYKEKIEFKNFINSINSFEDFIRKELNYNGRVSLKEFLKLNDHRGNSIAGAAFNANSGAWDKLLFTMEGESPKIVELSSGKVLVGWQSWNNFFAVNKGKELDPYTDQEIEDRLFGRQRQGIPAIDSDVDFEEYIQFGLYDPKTKKWTVDSSSLKCSPTRYSLCMSKLDHQSENVLVVWEEREGNWVDSKIKLLASVYDPVTQTHTSKNYITKDLVKDFGIRDYGYITYDLKINVNKISKDSATITIDAVQYNSDSIASSKTCKVKLS